MMEKIT